MSRINIKANNFNNTPVIKEDDFNELMISNDEDKIFNEFIKYLPIICRGVLQGKFNVIDIKRLFSINLKIFDCFMFSDDFKQSSDQEAIDELQNVYDRTHYIVNNVDSVSYNNEEMLKAITIVNSFWNKKLDEQKKFGETLKETNSVLEDGFKKISNSLKIKEISDFGKKNMTTRSSEVTQKALEYLEDLKEMLRIYPKSIIDKVLQIRESDRNYYSKIENQKKENVDELTINNIITCLMLISTIK